MCFEPKFLNWLVLDSILSFTQHIFQNQTLDLVPFTSVDNV